MVLVIDRIRQKQISDDEIRAYFASPTLAVGVFRDLAARFAEHWQAAALELVHLPFEHPFWAVAPQSQNLQYIVCAS